MIRTARSQVAVALALAVVTFAVYWPVTGFDFTNYDDADYFWANPHVLGGLTWENAGWAFRAAVSNNWHPLTWLSLMLDATLFGKGPAGPHAVNLLFHAANSVLLFLLLRQLTGAFWRSAMVAGLFAVHPLHVESVAWISERKDVLSTLFGFLSLIFYVRYAGSKTRNSKLETRNYCLSLFFFTLGLMSKPMLVTWPFVMLLLDYWPLKRISDFGFRISDLRSVITRQSSLFLEKLPFFILSAASCVLTVWAQRKGGVVVELADLPMGNRIANAFVACALYLGKMFWPVNLAVFYPHPEQWPGLLVVLAVVLVAGLSLVAVWLGRCRPYAVVGWFWFLGTLVPVIGLVQVAAQCMADRYTYVPLIGVFVILVWGAGEVVTRWAHLKFATIALGVLILCACVMRTRDQLRYWQNGETLSRRALAVTRNNELAHNNLGYYLFIQGRWDEAMKQYQQALQIAPKHSIAHCNLGIVLAAKGQLDDAVAHFTASLQSDPNYPDAHINLADVLVAQGKFTEAIQHYNEALKVDPDSALVHNNLGNALAKLGRLDEAMEHYAEAVRLKPGYAEARNNLGNMLAMTGRLEEAIVQFRAAIQYKTNYASAHSNLGVMLASRGKFAEAISHYREALRLEPNSATVLGNLGYALTEIGRYEEATECLKEAMRLNPDDAQVHFYMGNALLRTGRREEAIAQFTETLRLKPDHAEAREQLRAPSVPTIKD